MMTKHLAFTALLASVLFPCCDAAAQSVRPNIIVILADDLGYADVGFQGCQDIPTPHLDALAAGGVRFSSGYVSGPYCSPTRAGLLTGRYQQRFGHEFNPPSGKGLPTSEVTIAARLQKAGYATGLVGKWHLGNLPEMHPQRRGFADFFGFLAGAHDYFNSAQLLRGNQPVQETEYLTDVLGREAAAFIDAHRQEPFFLYLSFNAVHTPRQADEARLAKFAAISDPMRKIYAAMTSAMDDAVGQVRAKLLTTGLNRNTVIFFLSDNGGPVLKGTTSTRNGSSNAPLRGSKRTTLEGGIRVPFVISYPSELPTSIYDLPVSQLDILPTVLALAGVPVQPDDKLDGVNLLPYITGKNTSPPHDKLYWRLGDQMAIRSGDYKLVRSVGEPDLRARLYHVQSDIGESQDLAAKMPEKVKQLQADWDAWSATLATPLWPGNHD